MYQVYKERLADWRSDHYEDVLVGRIMHELNRVLAKRPALNPDQIEAVTEAAVEIGRQAAVQLYEALQRIEKDPTPTLSRESRRTKNEKAKEENKL